MVWNQSRAHLLVCVS